MNYIFWANQIPGMIGRATIDGRHIQQQFIADAEQPNGIAIAGGRTLLSGPAGR